MARKGKQHRCQTLSSDVLSDLPGNVLDDILGCLPIENAVRTSILSKKWRYIWRRVPYLTVDQTLSKPKHDLEYLFSYYREIINHILAFHRGPITKLTLCIPYLESCPDIGRLICFLGEIGIHHLVLRFPIRGYPYRLRYSFFTCLQLRHLTLHNCLIAPPSDFKGFERLISLELCHVTITSKDLESLIYHCLLLEQLVLQISGAFSEIIEINAPKLRSFIFTGSLRSICLKSIPLLAKVSLTHRESYAGAGKCNIAKLFESFSALESLHLNDMIFAAGAGELPERLPFNLDSVNCLCISGIFLSDLGEVSCALCLIRSFTNLQYLEIKVEGEYDDIPALECLEVERFSNVTFNCLKEVKLLQTNGTIHEMRLIKLLLEKSPELVRMLIEPCRVLEDHATIKILDELTKFQRASPKAEVVYKLDKHPKEGQVTTTLWPNTSRTGLCGKIIFSSLPIRFCSFYLQKLKLQTKR